MPLREVAQANSGHLDSTKQNKISGLS